MVPKPSDLSIHVLAICITLAAWTAAFGSQWQWYGFLVLGTVLVLLDIFDPLEYAYRTLKRRLWR